MQFTHVNIIARDWRALSAFYQTVFGCKPTGPRRDLSGSWIERMTGIAGVHIEGEHLLLPGHGERLPTLEIFSYKGGGPEDEKAVNRCGFAHIAFAVQDVQATRQAVLDAGGSEAGEVVQRDYGAMGFATFVYVRDPEGNLMELQHWAK